MLAEAGFVEGLGLGEFRELGAGGLPGEVAAGAEQEDKGGEDEDVPRGAGLAFGEAFLPALEFLAELLRVVAELKDGILEGGVIGGGVPEVALGAEAGTVGGLEIAKLRLVGGGVRVVCFPGEIEPVGGSVLLAGGTGEEDVGFFPWRRA